MRAIRLYYDERDTHSLACALWAATAVRKRARGTSESPQATSESAGEDVAETRARVSREHTPTSCATPSPADSLAYAEGYATDTTARQPDISWATPSPADSLAYAEGYATDTTARPPDISWATPSPADSLAYAEGYATDTTP